MQDVKEEINVKGNIDNDEQQGNINSRFLDAMKDISADELHQMLSKIIEQFAVPVCLDVNGKVWFPANPISKKLGYIKMAAAITRSVQQSQEIWRQLLPM